MHNVEKLQKMLEVVRDEILPLTESEVARGNHVSGGAILRSDTLTSVMVGADNRLNNPLTHGQIDALNRYFKLPVRPPAEDLIFLATHEPCPMCASAIAVAGFKEFWVLFDVEGDEEMYRELFGVEGVRAENAYFTKRSLKKAVSTSPEKEDLLEVLEEIEKRYAALSAQGANRDE